MIFFLPTAANIVGWSTTPKFVAFFDSFSLQSSMTANCDCSVG